jgi:hypothetical protein
MSKQVDVLAVLDRCVEAARSNAKAVLGGELGTEAIAIYGELNQARAAISELIEAGRLAEFHFSQWDEARLPGEKAHSLKYLRGEMSSIRAALANVQGPQA